MSQTKNKHEYTNTSELRGKPTQIHGKHGSVDDCINEGKQTMYTHAYSDKSG